MWQHPFDEHVASPLKLPSSANSASPFSTRRQAAGEASTRFTHSLGSVAGQVEVGPRGRRQSDLRHQTRGGGLAFTRARLPRRRCRPARRQDPRTSGLHHLARRPGRHHRRQDHPGGQDGSQGDATGRGQPPCESGDRSRDAALHQRLVQAICRVNCPALPGDHDGLLRFLHPRADDHRQPRVQDNRPRTTHAGRRDASPVSDGTRGGQGRHRASTRALQTPSGSRGGPGCGGRSCARCESATSSRCPCHD